MSGQETARAQEATGELNIWTHLSNSESGPTCESSLRGQKFRSVALSGDRIAAITDANNGSISWFPKYRGWSSASSLPQKEGKESFENKTETETASPGRLVDGLFGRMQQEVRRHLALLTRLAPSAPTQQLLRT